MSWLRISDWPPNQVSMSIIEHPDPNLKLKCSSSCSTAMRCNQIKFALHISVASWQHIKPIKIFLNFLQVHDRSTWAKTWTLQEKHTKHCVLEKGSLDPLRFVNWCVADIGNREAHYRNLNRVSWFSSYWSWFNPYQNPDENVALSAKWNIHIWNWL